MLWTTLVLQRWTCESVVAACEGIGWCWGQMHGGILYYTWRSWVHIDLFKRTKNNVPRNRVEHSYQDMQRYESDHDQDARRQRVVRDCSVDMAVGLD